MGKVRAREGGGGKDADASCPLNSFLEACCRPPKSFIEYVDEQGVSALHALAFAAQRQPRVVEETLDKMLEALMQHPSILDLKMTEGPPSEVNALQLLCGEADLGTHKLIALKKIIEARADVTAVDRHGSTILHRAVGVGYTKAAEYILKEFMRLSSYN